MGYSIGKLAAMAGITVRTLHHYDRIGLLSPPTRPGTGYREYGEGEVARLQRILFYRELDFPLAEIARVLADPAKDGVAALREQKALLGEKADRLSRLIGTIDRTIARLGGEEGMTDEEMFEGFAPEKREAIRKETEER